MLLFLEMMIFNHIYTLRIVLKNQNTLKLLIQSLIKSMVKTFLNEEFLISRDIVEKTHNILNINSLKFL
jgi:hypothetical protein